jgi:hypothetical protein
MIKTIDSDKATSVAFVLKNEILSLNIPIFSKRARKKTSDRVHESIESVDRDRSQVGAKRPFWYSFTKCAFAIPHAERFYTVLRVVDPPEIY